MLATFYIASAIAIIATVMVITRHNLIHALLYLVVSFLAIAVVFYLLGASFIAALEVIGYDPATEKFPSTVFASMIGVPIPYEYDVQGDRVTIRTELAGGATFTGTWAEDGSSMSGGWRPDPGKEGPGNVAYDISGTRAR